MLDTIDDYFLYEYRWEFFDKHTDSELLYETYHLEEFVDTLYDIFYSNEVDSINTITLGLL